MRAFIGFFALSKAILVEVFVFTSLAFDELQQTSVTDVKPDVFDFYETLRGIVLWIANVAFYPGVNLLDFNAESEEGILKPVLPLSWSALMARTDTASVC